MHPESNTAPPSPDDGFDERFNNGFDPLELPAVTERLERICRVVLQQAPEFEVARLAGDGKWLEAETASMVLLLKETIQLRLTDLEPPTPAAAS